ncbi:hypothetical protein CIPAW_03G127600 [Carya illinoinensis]|nr:hypothetical protein CIPAW_03G127600 [Carya illinoinensis]
MFLRSENDHFSIQNAKEYFRCSMKLAETVRENPPVNESKFFLKGYIDAHNNIGMLEIDLDNLDEAQKILTKGLQICADEEVEEDYDGRSRLHHNLGNVYMELRMWDEARKHIEEDIKICKRIGHCQGEAKGYINFGELHYRVQKYEEALCCYRKALDLAKSMEDEDALATQIKQNIETVKEAIKVMGDLKKEEQNLKKLTREMTSGKGTARERKCLLQQNASLDCLIEKSRMILAWLKLLEFAKRKKRVASALCDKEKLGDSFLAIGESYQKIRKFNRSIKWYMKSWETYKSIGNLEGQALAKINIGNVLDSDGDWTGALDAFEESYRISIEANLPSIQLSALENMHYSHMIRFDNVEEARSRSPNVATQKGKLFRSSSIGEVVIASDFAASGSKCDIDVNGNLLHKHNAADLELLAGDRYDWCIIFKIDKQLILVEASSCMDGDKLSIESIKVELACLYYLRLPIERRSEGLLPIIRQIKSSGRVEEFLETIETLKDCLGKVSLEASIHGWGITIN